MPVCFPPPGYVRTESAVEGIELYRQAPELLAHRRIETFDCPQCAGQRAYSVADGGLSCVNCGYYEPPSRPMVGKGAESFEFTVETMTRVARGWGHARKDLHCQYCGAHTTLPPTLLSYSCPFCGSNKVIQRDAPQDALRPRFLAPFALTEGQCQETITAWLRGHWLAPAALKRVAHGARLAAIYLPFWTIDATAHANWRAEVRRVRRIGGKTRVVWRWESGKVTQVFDDWLVPGATHVNPRLLEVVQPWDLAALVPYEAAYLAGIQAQAYEVTLDAAWESARRAMREQVRQRCRGQASSRRMRNFSMEMQYRDENWRYILLPLYLASYEHNRRIYQVAVNGQSGKIGGQRPADWRKVLGLTLAWLLPSLLAALIPAYFLPPSDLALTVSVLGALLFVAGLAFTVYMVTTALRMEGKGR